MFRDPKCTRGNSTNYDGLIQATCSKMLSYLHGREDANYTLKYGATILELLNKEELLKILKEKHHTISRKNTQKRDSSNMVIVNDQDSSFSSSSSFASPDTSSSVFRHLSGTAAGITISIN